MLIKMPRKITEKGLERLVDSMVRNNEFRGLLKKEGDLFFIVDCSRKLLL